MIDYRITSQIETQASGSSKNELQKLKKACEELEAVFLSLLWKNMAKQGGIDLKGWSVLAEEAIGKRWAETGGIGLAKVIYNSVSKSSLNAIVGDDSLDGRTDEKNTESKTAN